MLLIGRITFAPPLFLESRDTVIKIIAHDFRCLLVYPCYNARPNEELRSCVKQPFFWCDDQGRLSSSRVQTGRANHPMASRYSPHAENNRRNRPKEEGNPDSLQAPPGVRDLPHSNRQAPDGTGNRAKHGRRQN